MTPYRLTGASSKCQQELLWLLISRAYEGITALDHLRMSLMCVGEDSVGPPELGSHEPPRDSPRTGR